MLMSLKQLWNISELFQCFIQFYFTCMIVWNKTETNVVLRAALESAKRVSVLNI